MIPQPSNSRKEPEFLGTGWSFPPAFGDGGASVAMVSEADAVWRSIDVIAHTMWLERPLKLEFGCDLKRFMFEELDPKLISELAGEIETAITRQETRVEDVEVKARPGSGETGKLFVEVAFTVRGTNSRYNRVYPFHLEEGLGTALGT